LLFHHQCDPEKENGRTAKLVGKENLDSFVSKLRHRSTFPSRHTGTCDGVHFLKILFHSKKRRGDARHIHT